MSRFELCKMPFAHFAICILKEPAALLLYNHLFDHSVECLAWLPEFVHRFPRTGAYGNSFCCTLLIRHTRDVRIVTIYFFTIFT